VLRETGKVNLAMQKKNDPEPAKPDAEDGDPGPQPPVEIMERSEAKLSGVPLFTAHWHLFIPTIVIAVMYSFSWGVLVALGRIDTAIARLFVVVMAVGVPLLAAHAFLRYQTIRLQINEAGVLCHPGWPKEMLIEIDAGLIEKIVVKRGLAGRLFGGGALVLHLATGSKVVIADLGDPDKARETIETMIASQQDE